MSFFSNTSKGEISELKDGINSTNLAKKKESMKRIIGAMMSGTDVSSLLPSVLVNMQTTDLELKKLIYLYMVNYSKSEPELALHAVNTFDKDTRNPNPLIRALALRTMGCIRIDQITEYMCEPLHRCLKDQDPYVKKTAVLGVAKMFDINPSLVEEEGFIDMLSELLGDGNPMVVSNSVATLTEIQQANPEKSVFDITSDVLQKLVAALSQASEWGQVHIMDALALYWSPANAKEAARIAERVSLQLIHDNSAVVIAAVKIIIKCIPFIDDSGLSTTLCKKMAPPLVSLVTQLPEIRYVALRNLNLIIQRLPQLMAGEIKVFFCKYNDPIYVKMEKLEIMMLLVNERNVTNVLAELKEYATEVDVDFVRKAVRAIGRCAILLSDNAGMCVDALVNLVKTSQVNYVIQESIIVIKDIFRKYPNKYESIISDLCEKLQSLDEPEAKAAMIWIIGEYADRIEQADKILESYFVETFQDEPPNVQMALLTAAVKVFLAIPEAQAMVQNILKLATKKSDNPDLRDRGYVYWRLLSASKDLALQVVRGNKPPIEAAKQVLPADVLAELMPHLGSLASIFHKTPDSFSAVPKAGLASIGNDPTSLPPQATLQALQQAAQKPANAKNDQIDQIDGGEKQGDDDLIDVSAIGGAPPPGAGPAGAGPGGAGGALTIPPGLNLPLLLNHPTGLALKGDFIRHPADGGLYFVVAFFNGSQNPVNSAEIQFNKNSFGISPTPINLEVPVLPQQQRAVLLPVAFRQEILADPTTPTPANVTTNVQIGLKCDSTMLIFQQEVKGVYLAQYPPINGAPACQQRVAAVGGQYPPVVAMLERVNPREQCLSYFTGPTTGWVETNRMEKGDLLVVQYYGSIQPPLQGDIIVDLAFRPTAPGVLAAKVDTRSSLGNFAQILNDHIKALFSAK